MEAVHSRYLEYADWAGAELTIENELLRLHFSTTGLLTKMTDLEHQSTLASNHKVQAPHGADQNDLPACCPLTRQPLLLPAAAQFEYYRTTQSGAYLFRPISDNPEVRPSHHAHLSASYPLLPPLTCACLCCRLRSRCSPVPSLPAHPSASSAVAW